MKSTVNENSRNEYFLLDFLSSAVLGVAVFFAVHQALAGTEIPFLGMVIGMIIGFLISLAFSNLLAPVCGIFEVMIPFHFIGMHGGMFWAMAVVHKVFPFSYIFIIGGLCGIMVMACFYALDRFWFQNR